MQEMQYSLRLDKHMQIIYKKYLQLEEAIIIPSHALHGAIHFKYF